MPAITIYSEPQLIQMIKSKNRAGFDALYENYSGTFYHVIYRKVPNSLVAEDILQEVFVKIWKGIDQYDESKGKLYTWMLRVVRNTSIDYLRSQENKHKQVTRANEHADMNIPETASREIDFGLQKIVTQMEPKHRDVINTIFYGAHTYDEAAKKLGIPLGTLKSRARTALLMLRTNLAGEFAHLNAA
jgi:RNA polymerase sigma-70 factor (ECF subfamily)